MDSLGPLAVMAASIEADIKADDDEVDEFYRLMGKSEGEIASYRQTRWLIRQRMKQRAT